MITVKTRDGVQDIFEADGWTVRDDGHLHLFATPETEGRVDKKTVASFAPGSWSYVAQIKADGGTGPGLHFAAAKNA